MSRSQRLAVLAAPVVLALCVPLVGGARCSRCFGSPRGREVVPSGAPESGARQSHMNQEFAQ